MVDVPVKRKREKNNHLHEDHVFDVNVSPAFDTARMKALEILRHEDNICGRKANLTDDKRKVDEIAHPLSVKNVAHFAKRNAPLLGVLTLGARNSSSSSCKLQVELSC